MPKKKKSKGIRAEDQSVSKVRLGASSELHLSVLQGSSPEPHISGPQGASPEPYLSDLQGAALAQPQSVQYHTHNAISMTDCSGITVGNVTIFNEIDDKLQGKQGPYSRSQELTLTSHTSQVEEQWQKVVSKKNKKYTKDIPSTPYNLEASKIEDLMNTPPGNNVVFQEDEKTYLGNPLKFSLDIVSMWNTPQKMSRIVLGIKATPNLPNFLVGLKSHLSQQQLQDLFEADYFNTKPNYTYQEFNDGDKYIGVMEVGPSTGQGKPCVTIKDSDIISNFKADQLWYRNNSENVISQQSNPSTSGIYKWFLASKQTTLKAQNCYQEEQTQVLDVSTFTSDTALKLEHFGQGYSILVSGKVPSHTKHIGALAKIPWLYVFDFDVASRESGLLAACRKQLEETRSFYITYWDHPTNLSISDQATIWCFLNGSKDRPESILPEEQRRWKKITKSGIEKHCADLARFLNDRAVLNILVVWPNLNFCLHHLIDFLRILDDFLDTTPSIIVCFEQQPTNDVVASVFKFLHSVLHVRSVRISPEQLFFEFETHPQLTCQSDVHQLQLPSSTGESVAVSNKDYAWLREDLYVLFLETPFNKSTAGNEIEMALDAFFKGGTAHWSTWYVCGPGYFDIQRDIMDSILKRIRTRCSNHSKSSLITLLHAPGSGGTTLAQRIVWELHSTTPCVQVKASSSMTLEQIVSKIYYLYQQTNSCIVILLDGEDEERVNMLFKMLYKISFIILYVKRHPYRRKEAMERENGVRFLYWLKGEVSERESKILTIKLQERIQDTSRVTALKKLTKGGTTGKRHCLYEFGLTAYLHEFLGIRSYVKGYLKLGENKQLQNWHFVVGFLALVYHYGQASVPCQFFARLLGLPQNETVVLEDFPPNAQELIVKDISDNRDNQIRTSHYIIAQEILEQILTRHRKVQTLDTNCRLSNLAKKNLKQFALEFIKYTGDKTGPTSSTVQHIVARTFIHREYRDFDNSVNYTQQKKKHTMSRLLLDIDSQPPYTERLEVLETLTQTFPTDPNLRAHLGRFYVYSRPDDFEKAEECFKKALSLCDKITNGDSQDPDERLRLTLMHVYHMYGMLYTRRIKNTANTVSTMNALDLCERACELFSKCRDVTPTGFERCHAYVGEISVRLELCELIEKTGEGNIKKTINSVSTDPRLSTFLQESISEIDILIMSCCNVVSAEELDKSFYDLVLMFNTLFHKHAIGLDGLQVSDSSRSRRLKIALTKLKYSKNLKTITSLDHVSKEDINDIIRLYEDNFQDFLETGDIGNRSALEMDHKEWIFAIRLVDATYTLEKVHTFVHKWNEYIQSPLSLFYLFVTTSLIGFGLDESGKSMATKNICLTQAYELKQRVQQLGRRLPQPRYPREWLGKGSGIRQLISYSRFANVDSHGRKIFGPSEHLLVRCKGTICPSSKLLSGYIDLDLHDNSVSVKVFFVPKVCDLTGKRFEGTRVEFRLAFTLDHGYEAFNVVQIKTESCLSCKTAVEMTSDETSVRCPCGATVTKIESDLFDE